MKYKVNFELEFKKNPYKGKFIVIEGIDGSGKTTQTSLIKRVLEKEGKRLFITKNPRPGPMGDFIYKVLRKEVVLPSESIQFLYSADLIASQLEVIEHLKKGEWVLSDRYFWSSVAYGMVDMKKVASNYLEANSILLHFHQFLLPDLSIYLDIDPNLSMKRVHATGKPKEHYKKKTILPKIQKGYIYLMKRFPDEFKKVDAKNPVEKVTQDIVSLIGNL